MSTGKGPGPPGPSASSSCPGASRLQGWEPRCGLSSPPMRFTCLLSLCCVLSLPCFLLPWLGTRAPWVAPSPRGRRQGRWGPGSSLVLVAEKKGDTLWVAVFRRNFPGGSAGKESACSAGDLASIPGLGRSPREGKRYPLQYSGLGNSMDRMVQRVAKGRTRLSDFSLH